MESAVAAVAPRKPRRRWPLILAIVLTVVAVSAASVVGIVLVARQGGSGDDPKRAIPSASTSPDGGETPSAEPSAEPSTDGSAPEAEPRRARCWDGSVVVRGERTCPPPVGRAAMKFAFPIDWSRCTPDPGGAHNRLSHRCLIEGVSVHVAAYRDPVARTGRLAEYGPCESRRGGRLVCVASDTTARWVRTYDDPSLPFYASTEAEDHEALMRLPQRSAKELSAGVPLDTP